MTTQEVLEKLYGVKLYKNTQSQNSSVSSSVTPIVDQDPGSVFILIVNLGSNDIYLWTDETVSTTNGILLQKNGGNMVWYANQHFLMPTERWFGVTATGSSEISVQRYSILQG